LIHFRISFIILPRTSKFPLFGVDTSIFFARLKLLFVDVVVGTTALTTAVVGEPLLPLPVVVNAVVPTTTSTNSSLSLAKKIEVSTPKSGNFDVLGSIMKDMRK
jgi:hypothetical protein